MGSVERQEDDRERTGLGALLRVPVELWIVVVMMALAFGAGIVVTALYQEPQDQVVIGTQVPAGQITMAPPLTDDQISEGLPSGHPDISGETGSKGDGGGQPKGDEGEAAKDAPASEGNT